MGGPLTASARAALGEVPGIEVFESDHRLEWMDTPWDDVARAGDWLLGLEERTRPDIVHLNAYCHAALPFRAPRVVVAHSCVLSWWRAVRGEEAPRAYDRYRAEVARGVAAAAAVVAPTVAMLRAVERHYGPPASGHVVANGRDPRVFRPAEKERFVFAAGRLWDEAKNLAALEAIAARLPWPVLVAGNELGPGGLGRRAGGGLCALGWMSEGELAWWMARAGIYALPARYEPFGLSVLEAGLSGCALVLGDIESLREVWADAAVFVPPSDTAALARAIEDLAADPARRAALGAAAQRRAARFDPGTMARRYLEIYDATLSAGSAPRPGAAPRALPLLPQSEVGEPCE
jgi:glycosyltransferase involved in cell wall biosynthesis